VHQKRRLARPARSRGLTCTAAYAAGAPPLGQAAAATLWQRFPVAVLGAAALALAQPQAFTWFHPAYNGQHALTCFMLAAGLTLSLEVSCWQGAEAGGGAASGVVLRAARADRLLATCILATSWCASLRFRGTLAVCSQGWTAGQPHAGRMQAHMRSASPAAQHHAMLPLGF